MGYPYAAYLTGHYRYDGGRTPTRYWDDFELWFATKQTGAWVSSKIWDVATEYSQAAPDAKGGVAIANNGSEFLAYVYIYGSGFGFDNDLTRIMKSMDGGATWADVGRTTWPSDIDEYGMLAHRMYYSAGFWVLFSDNGVYVSADGTDWEFRANDLLAASPDPDMCLMDNQGTLHMCCVKNSVIHYGRSTDLGATWTDQTPMTRIAASAYYAGDRPALTAYDGHVILTDTLEDGDSIGQGVFANFSHDGGVTWEPDTTRIEYLVPLASMEMVRISSSGMGFAVKAGVISACFSTSGTCNDGLLGDDYREWSYCCPDWREDRSSGSAHTWSVDIIGWGRENIGSGVDPDTGISTFFEDLPLHWVVASSNTLPHASLVEIGPPVYLDWTSVFDGFPDPLNVSAPTALVPDLYLVMPYAGRYLTIPVNPPVPNFKGKPPSPAPPPVPPFRPHAGQRGISMSVFKPRITLVP